MRRRNVPCSPCGSGTSSGCGCCSLKEKLAILWDRTIGSILKINNMTPDGEGKFEIRAGQNVTITDISNGIEISATGGGSDDAVKSVNGILPDQNGNFMISGASGKNGVTVTSSPNGIVLSIGDKISTINNVGGDTFGNMNLVAGQGVDINEDSVNHEIEISAKDVVKSIEVQSEGTVLPDANGKITILVGTNMDIIAYPSVHQIALSSTATALIKKSHTLTAANWSNNQLTVSESEITATNDVFVSPDPSDWSDYNAAGIRAVSQGTGTLTFECDTTPTADIGVNLVIGRLNV